MTTILPLALIGISWTLVVVYNGRMLPTGKSACRRHDESE
jgi:hypothetical protein